MKQKNVLFEFCESVHKLLNINTFDSQSTHIESLKFPTTPGLSPGVGLRKQGLLALQMIPCTQGRVPAEGMALFGKWPEKIYIQIQI